MARAKVSGLLGGSFALLLPKKRRCEVHERAVATRALNRPLAKPTETLAESCPGLVARRRTTEAMKSSLEHDPTAPRERKR